MPFGHVVIAEPTVGGMTGSCMQQIGSDHRDGDAAPEVHQIGLGDKMKFSYFVLLHNLLFIMRTVSFRYY